MTKLERRRRPIGYYKGALHSSAALSP